MRGEKNTIGVPRYTFSVYISLRFDLDKQSLPAVPVNLPYDRLVRRCEAGQVTFSQSAKRLALGLLSSQGIKLDHLASFLLQLQQVGVGNRFPGIAGGRQASETVVQVAHDEQVGGIVRLRDGSQRVGGVELEVR